VVGRGRAGAWLPSLARTSLVRLSVNSRAVVVMVGEGGTGVVPRAERRVERRLVVSEEEEAGVEGLAGVVLLLLLLLLLAVVVCVVPAILARACSERGEGEKGVFISKARWFWRFGLCEMRKNSYASKSARRTQGKRSMFRGTVGEEGGVVVVTPGSQPTRIFGTWLMMYSVEGIYIA